MKTKYKFILLIIISCLSSIWIYYIVERVKPVEKKIHIINHQYELEQNFKSDGYTIEKPNIILNPYEISPLTALIIFETNDMTSPTVTIKGKDSLTTYTNTFKASKTHYLPIYGLYPDAENTVIVTVNEHDYTFKIKTDKLPEDFNTVEYVKSDKKSLNNDLYFVTPSSIGYTAAYDVNGDVRWYLTTSNIWDISRLNNGHLLLSSDRLINPPYYTVGLSEMDLLGKIYYEYTIPGGYHHDYFELENGNLLVLSDDFSSGTVEDYIVEIDRKTGNIVKEIDLKDILNMTDGKSENWTNYDWFHNNSIWYDKKTNSITLSGRHMDAVININYDTLKLNWIIGDSTNWSTEYLGYFFKPIGNFEWQWSQHAAEILPNGDVFIFDNGNNRSKDKDKYLDANKNYSRGVIYRIDTKNMTIKQVYEYGKERGSSLYSPYISDVDYLSENNYLIHFGGNSKTNGKVNNTPASFNKDVELSSTTVELLNNKVIFEMKLNTNLYRAEKMSLYSNDEYTLKKGEILGSLGVTETSDNVSTLINKDAKDILKEKNIKVYEEADRLVVSGKFNKDEKVKIILDNLFSKKTYNMIISKKPYTAMCVDVFNSEEEKNGINVTKYINKEGLQGKYYIYIKINDTVYDLNEYIVFN